jgi:transposase-like protein
MTGNGRTLSLNTVSKKHDEAFKRQAVEMVLRDGKKMKQMAEELE